MRVQTDQKLMKRGRLTALVIAGSVFMWLIANSVGPKFGLAVRYAILADLIVMAALFWALANCIFIWRKRQNY